MDKWRKLREWVNNKLISWPYPDGVCHLMCFDLCKEVDRLDYEEKHEISLGPVGIPGQRDPEFPCEHFSPGEPDPLGFSNCYGDGHYLCNECENYVLEVEEIEWET